MQRRAGRLHFCIVLSLALFLVDRPGWGGEPLEERVEQLETEVAAMRQDVAALRTLLERLVAGTKNAGKENAGKENAGQDAAAELGTRVESVEAATRELASEQEELAAAVKSTEIDVDALGRTDRRKVQINVYGTFNSVDDERRDSVFDAEAFELVLSGRPHERLGFFAEIELERAATIGGSRGGELLLEQAYATYTLAPWLNLRAGVLLVPFGNFNVDHFAPNRDVVSKPLVSYTIAASDWTDNGVGIHGSTALSGPWSFNYETYLTAGLDADVTGLGTRAARQGFGEDNNRNKAWVGRFAWSRGGRLELGVSGYSGKYDDANRLRLAGFAVDAFYQKGRLKLTGEINRFNAEQASGPDAVLEGYYGRVVVDVTPPFLRRGWHGSVFPDARLDLVGQYDRARLEGPVDGVFETNIERRFTWGLNYRPSHHWVLKVQIEDSEATNRPLQLGETRVFLGSIGFQF